MAATEHRHIAMPRSPALSFARPRLPRSAFTQTTPDLVATGSNPRIAYILLSLPFIIYDPSRSSPTSPSVVCFSLLASLFSLRSFALRLSFTLYHSSTIWLSFIPPNRNVPLYPHLNLLHPFSCFPRFLFRYPSSAKSSLLCQALIKLVVPATARVQPTILTADFL